MFKKNENREIRSDDELNAIGANNKFVRKEKLESFKINAVIFIIGAMILGFIIMGIYVVYQKMKVNDVESIDGYLKLLGSGVLGYALRYIEKS